MPSRSPLLHRQAAAAFWLVVITRPWTSTAGSGLAWWTGWAEVPPGVVCMSARVLALVEVALTWC